MALEERNVINATALRLLPECVTRCSAQISRKYLYQTTQTCFCSNTTPRALALQSCLKSNCTLDDQLSVERFQAQTCGILPRDKQSEMRAVIYMLFIVAIIFTLARLLSRWPRLRGAGYWSDDFVVVLGGGVLVAMMVDSEFELRNGWFYIAELIYVMGTRLPKLSLVLLYVPLWPEKKTLFQTKCWLVALLLVLSAISSLVATIFSCNPITYFWLDVVPGTSGTCVNRTALSVAQAATIIIFDVVVILLPIPKLLELPLSPQHKAGVCSVFLVGFAVTACSGVRLSSITIYSESKNSTYDFYSLALWSHIEVYLSMICCSMPQMPGLLRRLWWYLTKGKQRLGSNASRAKDRTPEAEHVDKFEVDEVRKIESGVEREMDSDDANLTALPEVKAKHLTASVHL